MPHTTTKNLREKRPDTRPNGKLRRSLKRKLEDAKSIQELRVTRVQRNEKIERISQPTPLNQYSKKEKYVKALKKKLKAIEELVLKQREGIELDEQQLEKLATLDSVMLEMDRALGSFENVQN
jgi:hypothetical protein